MSIAMVRRGSLNGWKERREGVGVEKTALGIIWSFPTSFQKVAVRMAIVVLGIIVSKFDAIPHKASH